MKGLANVLKGSFQKTRKNIPLWKILLAKLSSQEECLEKLHTGLFLFSIKSPLLKIVYIMLEKHDVSKDFKKLGGFKMFLNLQWWLHPSEIEKLACGFLELVSSISFSPEVSLWVSKFVRYWFSWSLKKWNQNDQSNEARWFMDT